MIKMVTLECPKCGALLEPDDREIFFCGHCGAKIMLHNENEHVYHIIQDSTNTFRYIDETEIARIEAEKQLEIKRIESKEELDKSSNKTAVELLKTYFGSLMLLFIIPLVFLLIAAILENF